MTRRLQEIPVDQQAREQALDITSSYIVQAPAGSGKTELLTQRFLKLLTAVDEPEQVLAITFTKAATAEMRKRVLDWLEEAQRGGTEHEEDSTSLRLSREVLRHSQQREWHLLEQPQRLNIQTIDSLCLSIAHRTPLLSRLGGTLRPTEIAEPMYALAANRTLQRLGGDRPQLNAAIEALLKVRDNNLRDCEVLIAEMLKQRDQWQFAFPLNRETEDWDEVRSRLERPFRQEIRRVLDRAHALFSREPQVVSELLELANHACNGPDLKNDIGLLAGLKRLPQASEDFVQHWECLTNLLLTKGDTWLRRVDRRHGFSVPGGGTESQARQRKERMLKVIAHLETVPGLIETLCAIRGLPPARYDESQWELLRHIFTALLYAMGELKVVFAERNEVDFVELGLAADTVLRAADPLSPDAPSDLALALSDRVRHLLIDEFQDTSRRQYELLRSLVRGWEHGDGRTCFLVGDPMQSIYLFRQAEVELFTRLQQRGLEGDGTLLEFDTLQLETNFRSDRGVVDPLNTMFAAVFGENREASSVQFTPSVAKEDTPTGKAVHIYPDFVSTDATRSREEKAEARQREAARVVEIVEQHLPEAERAAKTGEEFAIAVLVRAKAHLALISEAFRNRSIPYRSIELETLNDRQEILDLVALTRALVHPADRVAWLSVLRAPWCGLALADLHALAGNDAYETDKLTVMELLEARLDTLSADGRARAQRVHTILSEALRVRYRQSASPSFSSWVERTWQSLGGADCVDGAGYENAQAFFRMLDTMAPDGIDALGEGLEEQLTRLFALPDPDTNARTGVQLMTIHKAKGLGFNVVIVPGLERPTVGDRQSLVCWLERVPPTGSSQQLGEMLVAPIGYKGYDSDRLYRWVQRQKDRGEAEERKRLLYVACTRARQELHLLGTATVTSGSEVRPGDGKSLLATAWPAVAAEFVAAADANIASRETALQGELLQMPSLPEDDVEAEGEIDLAASAEDAEAATRSATLPPLTVRRLPLEGRETSIGKNVTVTAAIAVVEEDEQRELHQRPDASRESRALGTAIHALFEKTAKMLERTPADELKASLASWRQIARSILRNQGVAQASVEEYAGRAMGALQAALSDPQGIWILSPHPQAQSETSWTGWLDGSVRTLRVDRIFRGGSEPLSDGDDCIWIVDYKTAFRESDIEEFLRKERERYEEQLQSYGRVLRMARGGTFDLRLALYYPLLRRLKYWTA